MLPRLRPFFSIQPAPPWTGKPISLQAAVGLFGDGHFNQGRSGPEIAITKGLAILEAEGLLYLPHLAQDVCGKGKGRLILDLVIHLLLIRQLKA
jgi:hypothetical protein